MAGNVINGDEGWNYFSCFFIEIILTFGLVSVIFSSTIKENNFGNLTGFIVGISLFLLGITGSQVSGGSLNQDQLFPLLLWLLWDKLKQ